MRDNNKEGEEKIMVTSCPLGTSGFECSLVIYLIPGLIVLAAILFRKNIANDLLDMPFSLMGSGALGVLSYYIIYGIFQNLKWAVLAGVIGLLAGGFLAGMFLPDGESE